MRDLRYALRQLRKNPVFSLVAVVTLALGIGSTTAIYTVVDGVILEPLPFDEPTELVELYGENRGENQVRGMVSPMDFNDWRSQNRTFRSMAAYWPNAATLTEGDGNAERLRVVHVTDDWFDVLGARPLLGRTFQEADGPGSSEVLVLSHEFWQRRFGGDPGIVGRTLLLDGDAKEVIGVLQPGQTYPLETDVWINMTWPMTIQSRFARWMSAIGRMEQADGLEAARADMGALGARLAEEHPATNEGWTVRVERLHDELLGDARTTLWILMAATGVVLLVACANVANLLLSRSEVRAREMAVRAAMGAGRSRLVRQLLVESLLLSGVGAVAGAALAWVGVRGLLGLAPVALPRADTVGVDGTVLAVVAGLSVLTGLLFGLAPAVRLAGGRVQSVLRDGSRGSTAGGGVRLQNLFAVGQVGLAVVVVVAAGLLVRSFANLQAVDPGFQSGGVLTTELDLPNSVAPDDTAVVAFYDQLLTRIRDLPGVTAAGDASSLPLATDHDYVQPFRTDRADVSPEFERRAVFRAVNPGFFAAMRTPFLEGRGLEPSDRLGSAGVAVVNQAFRDRFLDGESPLGTTLVGIGYRFGPLGAINLQNAEIVGVVRDIKYSGLRGSPDPAIYFSGLQSSIRRRTLTIRTTGDPADLVPGVRREVEALSSQVALTSIQTLDDVMRSSRAGDRFATLLLSLFAGVALLLATIGVYGVLAYTVAQRRSELGIRMALGADRAAVRSLVLGDGLRMVGTGLVLGVLASLGLSRVLASQLYEVSPRDPRTLAVVVGVLLAAGLLASLVPAWRATRVDPLDAMRAR